MVILRLITLLSIYGVHGVPYQNPNYRPHSVDQKVIQILVRHPELTQVLVNYLKTTGDYWIPSVEKDDDIKIDERIVRALVKRPEAVDIILNYDDDDAIRRVAARRRDQYPASYIRNYGLIPIPR